MIISFSNEYRNFTGIHTEDPHRPKQPIIEDLPRSVGQPQTIEENHAG
jgi:hypothetical protein